MRQPTCIWLEHFAIQWLEGSMPELRGQPVALFNGRQRIIQANAPARAAGILPGMRSKEATARVAQLALHPLAAATDTRTTLRQLAGELLVLSPTVATWGDEEIFVDLAPSQHLHGGPEALVQRILNIITEAGWQWRGATAPTLSGARLAARLLADHGTMKTLTLRQSQQFIHRLPLTRLTALPEFLHTHEQQRLFGYLGVDTLGDLAAVPPHALRETLRPAEQELLDYARQSPQLTRHLEPVHSVLALTTTLPFFPPLVHQEPLLAHLEVTYTQLQETLFRRRLLLARVVLILVTEDLAERHLSIPLSRPTREPGLLLAITRLKLADVTLTRPLVECRIEVAEVAREAQRSRDLLVWHRQNHLSPMAELCSRLEARLGRRNALFTLRAHPAPRPEEGYLFHHAPEAAQQPLPPPPAVLPGTRERSLELPLLIVTGHRARRIPQALTEHRPPDYLFELYDPATATVVRTEYHCLRWLDRPVLARVRDRMAGEVVALDD